MIQWQTFPRSRRTPDDTRDAIAVFQTNLAEIDSATQDHKSNYVLAVVTAGLAQLGFQVELGKKHVDQIKLPVLYGLNGTVKKSFDADAYQASSGTVMEVEAGRAVVNNQFLKDLFQACVMPDARNLVIVVRNRYGTRKDFQDVVNFMDTLYSSGRLQLPLETVTIVGY